MVSKALLRDASRHMVFSTTLHTAVPVRANGATGSVRVSGMQTSTTKRPDALKAQEHGLKVLECGGISVQPICLGLRPQNRTIGAVSNKQKSACSLSVASSQNPAKTVVLRR